MTQIQQRLLPIMLQQLHFPYPIQPTSFTTPNFVLTSQILYFLLNSTVDNQKYQLQISTQQQRVNFINTACKIFAQHFSIQLDSKKLYCSDTKAVGELFRLCKIILQEYYGKQEVIEQPNSVLQTQGLSDACNELLTTSTQLLIQLRDTSLGSIAVQLQDALGFNPGQQQIQKAVEKRIEDLQVDIEKFQTDIQVNTKEKINLQEALSSKQADLGRLSDRLQNMKSSRPAWIGELQDIEHYARKHRSLSWLEWVVSQKENAKDQKNNEKEAQKLSLIKERKEDQQKEIRENAGLIGEDIYASGEIQVNTDEGDLVEYEEQYEEEYEYTNNEEQSQHQAININNDKQKITTENKEESASYYYEEEYEEESQDKQQVQQQEQTSKQQVQQVQQVQQKVQQQPNQQDNQESGSYYYEEEYEEEDE